ncbi:MAG: aminotransferase class I/II-fold pyridoxal phosphate-dependent enzyme [Pseudoxanthomonas sp.]
MNASLDGTPANAALHARFDAITAAQLRAGGGMKWTTFPDCIGAFVAEMDFGAAPAVAAALHAALEQGRTGYPTAQLFHELAEATAGFVQRRHGWTLPVDAVQPVPDVIKALEIMLRFHLPAGAPVIVPTPCYMPFVPLIEQLGHAAVQVPMRRDGGRHGFDYAAIDAAFAAGARALLLCNPHNPVGRVYRRAELERLADIVERHGARVFADEIHAPLIFGGHRHIPYASLSPAAAAHSITTVSASKAWNLPGLKCAQIVYTNPDDLRAWHRLGHLLTSNSVSTLGIVATLAAYRDGEAWLDSVLDYLRGNRDLLTGFLRERLPQVGYAEPEGTYLAWLDCAALDLPKPLGRWFRSAAKVAMTDGGECGAGFGDCIRLNFAMPRPLLAQALERIAGAIEAMGPASK